MQSVCVEIVKWKSKQGVSDEEMIKSADEIAKDLQNCKGFIHQSLCKNNENEWIDVYFWTDEDSAHASNDYMANKESFTSLLSLIEENSVKMEVMTAQQSSGLVISK